MMTTKNNKINDGEKENRHAGIYIHIPFCIKKCNYCAFLSFPSGEGMDGNMHEKYVSSLIEEIKMRRGEVSRCDTIYLGGGTPSILNESLIDRIITDCKRTFEIDENAEITLEANPATITRQKLEAWKKLGINRLSIGVQSMDDDRLKAIGRVHTRADVIRDFSLARETGFENINLDQIFSLPGTCTEDAIRDLKELIELEPEHMSLYSLQLEEGTPFYKMFEEGKLREVEEVIDRKTYHDCCDLLMKEGYNHYEISNFARAGYEACHNSKYWNMSEYLGLGLGASSFVGGSRLVNDSDLEKYISSVMSGKKPILEEHVNDDFDNISEAVFTGLRRKEGISFAELKITEEGFFKFFDKAREELEPFAQDDYLVMNHEGIRLTRKGIDISNKIMSIFV